MTTCTKDTLTIKFSLTSAEINADLSGCGDRYVTEWLPRILASDLSAELETLLAKKFASLSGEQKQQARSEVRTFTDAQIGARFRELVSRRLAAHGAAEVDIEFVKTLRVPDDGRIYPLPPGLGKFPMENLTHHVDRVPKSWSRAGGVMIPMHQSEAMWINFGTEWPTALKIGTGTVNAINGQSWVAGLTRRPQSYVVLPEQPWLDGYCASPGMVRQFVATLMGTGYSAEEQVLGTLRGGLQLEAFPVKVESYFEKKLREALPRTAENLLEDYLERWDRGALCSQSLDRLMESMGLGAGGKIKQEIYEDQWEPEDWDLGRPTRTWVHLVDAAIWKLVTGKPVPGKPLTAMEYSKYGFPWFDYYRDDMDPLDGSTVLANIKPVVDPLTAVGNAYQPDEWLSGLNVKSIGPDAPTDKVKEWDGKVTRDGSHLAEPETPLGPLLSLKQQKRLERQQANEAMNRFMLWVVSCGVIAVLVWIFFMSRPSRTFWADSSLGQPGETLIEKVKREVREENTQSRNTELRGALPQVFPPVQPLEQNPDDRGVSGQIGLNTPASAAESEASPHKSEAWQMVEMGEITAQFPKILQDVSISLPDGLGVSVSKLECKQAKWEGIDVGYTRTIYRDTDANLEAGIDNGLRSIRTDPRVINFFSQTKDFTLSGFFAKRTKGIFTIENVPFELEMVSIVKGKAIWALMVVGPSQRTGQIAERIFKTISVKDSAIARPGPDLNRSPSSRAHRMGSILPVENEFLDGKKVKFNTRGRAKAKGLNMTFYYPQSWQVREGERPNILQKFISEGGEGLEIVTILTKDMGLAPGTIVSDSELKAVFAADELKNMIPEGATLLNAKTTSIGGVPAGMLEFTIRTNRAGMEMETYNISFNFMINSTFVIFSGSVALMPESKTGVVVNALSLGKKMDQFRPLFTLMASSIVLEDKWK